MNQIISQLKASFSKITAVFLLAISFVVISAFSYGQPAQADSYTVDKSTVNRIQDKAEDLGDRSAKRGERPIGDTGLKNIKKLGENIPETLDMRRRQDTRDAFGGNPDNLNKAVSDVKGRVEETGRAAKQAVKNVVN